MKIRIGNFNFINKKENKAFLSTYKELGDLDLFYLDGKEDCIFNMSNYFIDKVKDNPDAFSDDYYKFEREVIKSFSRIINYREAARNQINDFIKEKVDEIYKEHKYLRYDLYNNITISDILNLSQSIGPFENEAIDFDTNKVSLNGFLYNLYTEKVENMEEKYNDNFFKKQIKDGLILKEIEDGKAPKFILEIVKINDFLNDKKRVNVNIEGANTYKSDANLTNIIDLRNNQIELNFGWKNDFEKANPDLESRDFEHNDLVSLSHGKNVLEIPKGVFKNLKEQISLLITDKFLFKLDELAEKVNSDYYDFYRDIEEYRRQNYSKPNLPSLPPYYIRDSINEITRNEIHGEEQPYWYKENKDKVENLFTKYQAVKDLKSFENIQQFEDGIKVFEEDKEFQEIAKEFRKTFDYDMGGNVYPISEEDEEEI